MSRRVCFALDLVNDAALINAYEDAHAPDAISPELERLIADKGFLELDIWRWNDRLFMTATVTDDWPCKLTSDQVQIEQLWDFEMSSYQRALPGTGPAPEWQPMSRVYSLARGE